MQIGHGYDIHKLVPNRKLIIGGVEIPYSKGLLGHTDGDVLSHAIIDALLGATGYGDIGEHFPDTDPKWKDANSIDLLEATYIALKNKGHKIVNIDSTIVAEEPALKNYILQMKKKIIKALELKNIVQISIKAKTNEGLGPVGEKQAICAWAIAMVL